MNCIESQELLSPYCDGELSAEARAAVAGHVGQCIECSAVLSGYRKLGDMISAAPVGAVPADIWTRIDVELNRGIEPQEKSSVLATSATKHQRPWLTRATYERLAIAASMLLVFGLSVWLRHDGGMTEMHEKHGPEFVAAMDHYLEILPESPDQAERFLLDKYDGRIVSPDQATSLVGYYPAVAEGLPDGYSLASTSVLKMPCCTCVMAVCKRADGSTLVLFEHDDEKVPWFGERPTSMAMCGDTECRLVDLGSSIAATWWDGSRRITAVGARDQAEVEDWVEWL